MNYLVFVENKLQVEWLASWAEKNPSKLSSTLVISLGLEIDVNLEKEKIAYRSISEFVTDEKIKIAVEKGLKWAKNWGPSFFSDTFYEEVSYSDYASFFTHACICQILIEGVLKKNRSRTVLLFPKKNVHYLFWNRMFLLNDVFDALLKDYIHKNKIKKEKIRSLGLFSLCKEVLKLFAIILDQIKQCSLFSSKSHLKTEKADILFAGWGFDFERHMSFDDIDKSSCYRSYQLAHLAWNKPRLKSSKNKIYDMHLSPLSFWEYFSQFFLKVFLKKSSCFIYKMIKQRNKKEAFLFKNKYLVSHFIRLFLVHYFQSYRLTGFLKRFLKEIEPKIVVTSDVNYFDHRILMMLAKRQGAITVSTNHGCYDHWVNKENYLADHVTVWGERIKENLVRSEIDANRLVVVGNSRYLKQPKEPKWDKNGSVLIITSEMSYSWAIRIWMIQRYKEVMNNICAYLHERGEERIVIKSHPTNDFYDFYGTLLNQYGDSFQHVRRRGPFEDLLQECKLIIVPGIISTALLECLHGKRPIIYYGGIYSQESDLMPGIGEIGARVETMDAFKKNFEKIVKSKKYRQEIIARGSSYLKTCTNIGDNNISKFNKNILDLYE